MSAGCSVASAPGPPMSAAQPRRSALHNSSTSAAATTSGGGGGGYEHRTPSTVSFSTPENEEDDDGGGSSRRSSSTAGDYDQPADGGDSLGLAVVGSWRNDDRRISAIVAASATVVAFVVYHLAVGDVGNVVARVSAALTTVASVACLFCGLALHLRARWSNTAVFALFAACVGAELASASLVDASAASTVCVLAAASLACVVSSSPVDVFGTALVVAVVSVARYQTVTMLVDLPSSVRPFVGYIGGLGGIFVERYLEARLVVGGRAPEAPVVVVGGSSVSSAYVAVSGARVTAKTAASAAAPAVVGGHLAAHSGRVADVMRRRRASSAVVNNCSSLNIGRRVSLPILAQKNIVSSCSYKV